jgi:bacteriorhodopsin
MDRSAFIALTFGTTLFGALCIAFSAYSLRRVPPVHSVLIVLVVLIAFLAYLAMALDFGTFTLTNPVTDEPEAFQLPRYLDWVLTTPLLLLSLIWVAMPMSSDLRTKLTLGIVAMDIAMIVLGALASIASSAIVKWFLFALSTVFYLAVVVGLFAGVQRYATTTRQGFLSLALYLVVLWLLYPVVWLLSPTGFNQITFAVENIFYVILDLLAKGGFAIFLFILLAQI